MADKAKITASLGGIIAGNIAAHGDSTSKEGQAADSQAQLGKIRLLPQAQREPGHSTAVDHTHRTSAGTLRGEGR